MNSIWTESSELPQFEELKGDVKTDVLIIGGGLAGILCAHFLQEQGVDYILAEGRSICSGITKNTTAKITAQHGLIYHKLERDMGQEPAKMYLDANQQAVKKYFELCRDMDCDFEEKTNFVYSLENRKKIEQEIAALWRLGAKAGVSEPAALPFPTAGAVYFEHQAQFHPLKFAAQIAHHLNIYEHTFVRELTENMAFTNKSSIRFEKVIFATHFPIDNKHGMYFLKMYQHRSYVIALENAAKLDGMYVDDEKSGLSLRSHQEYLLLGGGAHKTGKNGGNWQEIREFAKMYYPHAAEKYCWSTQDCMSLDNVPYIGQYSKTMPNYFVAAGFNKWGMTSAMAAAMILSDLVLENENPYAAVFHPSRSMLKPQLALNAGTAVWNLIRPAKRRCPHLGCALKWNSAEHSWDCPCHGSRFDEVGHVLDNPANGDTWWSQ